MFISNLNRTAFISYRWYRLAEGSVKESVLNSVKWESTIVILTKSRFCIAPHLMIMVVDVFTRYMLHQENRTKSKLLGFDIAYFFFFLRKKKISLVWSNIFPSLFRHKINLIEFRILQWHQSKSIMINLML